MGRVLFYVNAVQISCSCVHSSRLCRPAVRKGFAFPALLTGWKAEPSSRCGGRVNRAELVGKAEPFRTAGRQSREERSREQLIWTALSLPRH